MTGSINPTPPQGTEELLACPFGCARPDCLHCGTDNIDGGQRHQVWCNYCGMTGPHCDTEAEAITAWNRRADTRAPDTELLEKVRADVFAVLRRHDVSEQCFAEVAMITQAAISRKDKPHEG